MSNDPQDSLKVRNEVQAQTIKSLQNQIKQLQAEKEELLIALCESGFTYSRKDKKWYDYENNVVTTEQLIKILTQTPER